jgi:hypothetical protein
LLQYYSQGYTDELSSVVAVVYFFAVHEQLPQTKQALQLLVFQLALKFLRLGKLAHRLVEVVLVDGISVVLDREEAAVRIVSN